MYVTKADRTRQPFNKAKIVGTCVRMGASRRVAAKVAEAVEARVYDGIETNKILRIIHQQLGKYVPSVRFHIDLRRALSLIRPTPDFERFIRILLREHDYEVSPNQIIKGKCVEHEIDAIARKDGKTFLVEVKHHSNHHTPAGLDVVRIARAVLEDAVEGFEAGLNSLKIDGIIIVCNTKLSKHAREYAECRGILYISWKLPLDNSLRMMIENKKLYPLTFLKNLNMGTRRKLELAGTLLVKELVEEQPSELSKRTGISIDTLRQMRHDAREILSREESILS